MKSFLTIATLALIASAAQAAPNIQCQYFISSGHWMTFPTFTPGSDGHNGSLGTLGTINTSTASGSDAVCSRIISKNSTGNLIQQIAYQIDPADQQTPPDAGTCAFKGTKPFRVIFSKQIKTNAGQAHAVSAGALQVVDYTPTAKELSLWERSSDESATLAMTKKCVSFVKGSAPVPQTADDIVIPALDAQSL